MSKFFVWTASGDGDCLAHRLDREGHDVVLRIDEDWSRRNLEGLVPHTQRAPRQGEVVVFGTSKSGDEAAELQRAGFLVVGGAPIADVLEMQRWNFCQTCTRLGIDIPETKHFTNYDQARKFLTDDGGRFVLKPSGDIEASCTYVAHGNDDLLLMLDHFERTIPKAPDFLLQRFVEGIEISTEGWFNGEEWVDGAWNCTFEAKKFLSGDIGPATGCAWSTVWPYTDEPSWAKTLHRPFTEVLRKGRYVGPFDLNCIVTKDMLCVLECTPRFGLDAIQNHVELWNGSFGETLTALASGDLGELDVETDLVAASIRLSIPPYPSSSKDHRAPSDVPVLIDEGDWQRLWPSGIRYEVETEQYRTAPTDGVLGALVAHGTTLDRAVEKLLASARRIRIPNMQYRNDVGAGNGDKWAQLAKWDFPLPPTAAKLLKRAPAPDQRRSSGSSGLGVEQPAVFLAGKG